MSWCQQVVVILHCVTRWKLEGFFSSSTLESQNQVILVRIVILKSYFVTCGFMFVIGFGLSLIWTSGEYLDGEMVTMLVFQEYDPISALSHAMAFCL